MNKNSKKIKILYAVVLSILLLSIAGFWAKSKITQTDAPALSSAIGHATIRYGIASAQLSFSPGAKLYDVLLQAKKEGALSFSGENYPGLGFLVTDIGSLHQGGGKYLIYYVNGQQASVGVSAYPLKDGDVVEWKLE